MELTKRQEAEQEVTELKMLRISLGVMGTDRIRNKHIGGGQQRSDVLEEDAEERERWRRRIRWGDF